MLSNDNRTLLLAISKQGHIIINAQRMRTRDNYSSLFVCVCICSQSSSYIGHFYSKLNVSISFSEGFKDLQLTELSQKLLYREIQLLLTNLALLRPFCLPPYIRIYCTHGVPYTSLFTLLVCWLSRSTTCFHVYL